MERHPLIDSSLGRDAIERLCRLEGLRPDTARDLVETVRAQSGRRRRGLFDQFDALLAHDD